MAYNPYNTYKKIVARKGDWHNAQSLGQDPNQYYQAAIPLYQELYDNGYGDLADDLSKSNYTQAKGLLSKYGLKPDEQFNVDNAFNDMTGGGASTTTGQTDRAYGTDPSTQKLLDQATGAGQGYQDFTNQTQGIATGAVGTQPSQTVSNMMNAWSEGNDRLNGAIRYDENGNVVSGLNTEHYNIGRNQLDYINNFDVTKQPYYQGIMDAYRLGGQNAADNAYASGAADNGGNIDSYAAANANRQQLAFTTAGQQAALAAAQQNANNWQTLYSQMSQDLNNQGVLNANTLQQAAQLYSVDAQERMNALDVAGALQQQEMANAINAYMTNVQADMQKYGIDAETAMNRENNRAALEQITAQLAAQERMNTENNETTRLGYASQERMNTENNQTQRYGYDINRDIAGINANAQLGVAGINRDATLGAAGINADVNRYLGKLGYNQALAGYKNALDQIKAQSAANMSLAKYTDKIQREYNQSLIDQGLLPSGVTLQNPASGTTGGAGSVSFTPDEVATGIQRALQRGDYEYLSEMGFDRGMDQYAMQYVLTSSPYNFSLTDAEKVITALKKATADDDDLFVRMDATFPGVTDYKAVSKDRTKGASTTTRAVR